MHMYLWVILMRNEPLTEEVWSLFPHILLTSEAQAITMTTTTTVAPNKKFQMHARYFVHFSTVVCKITQKYWLNSRFCRDYKLPDMKFKINITHTNSIPWQGRENVIGVLSMLRKSNERMPNIQITALYFFKCRSDCRRCIDCWSFILCEAELGLL